MIRTLRYYTGAVLRWKMRRASEQFLRATADPRATQETVLSDLLALNAETAFARDHRLANVRNPEDFRRQVPVSDYDYHAPYIERVKQGETAALLGPRNRLLMFALTSGTTSASKFIPITQRFFADYRRGWGIWGIRAYNDHPAMFLQDILQLTSDDSQFCTPGGHPCGNISGLVSAIQNPIVRKLYAVPYIVSKIKSPEAKYYTALRLSVPNPHIGLVTTANPSTLIQLARLADLRRAELIRDIADGTLSSSVDVAADIRQALARRVGRPDRTRARELEQIVNRTGHLYPRDCWPVMSLIGVWTGGSAGAYLRGLKPYFGDAPIRDHGLSASEGRMTIPLADGRPDGILDITSHFFEFIPEAEQGSSQPTVLQVDELVAGKSYYILLTTASGLYRYNIHDVVRCTGFHGKTPVIEFLNKGAHISSITGEKISESQVVSALNEALARLDLNLSHYTVAPAWGDPPGYRLLIEERDLPAGDGRRQLATVTDNQLQAINIEYGEKRQTGRLAPLELVTLSPGTWDRFAKQRQSRLGGSVEQYKHPCLVADLQFCETFLREFAGAGNA